MAVLRTPLNISVSSTTRKAVKPLSAFKRMERAKPLKLPRPGKKAFLCMAVLILSALAGALTPWLLANLTL